MALGTKKTSYNEAEVIAGLKAGGASREKYTRFLYKQYAGFIIKGQRKYRLSYEEAWDAFTDSVIKLCKQIEDERFSTAGKMGGYLFRIFSNKCVDIVRKNSSLQVEWIDDIPEMQDEARNTLRNLIQKEQVSVLSSYMDKLGDTCKQILLDSEYYGYSIEEIAKRIGYKNGPSVSSKKYRCLEQLRKLIGTA
jgi:RNA polymerase sigma factor (sigma-70 family)